MANPNSPNNSKSSGGVNREVSGQSLSSEEVRALFKHWKKKSEEKRAAEERKKSEEGSSKSELMIKKLEENSKKLEPVVEEAKTEAEPIKSPVDSLSSKDQQETEGEVVKSDALTDKEREWLAKLLEKAAKQEGFVVPLKKEVNHQTHSENFNIEELVGIFAEGSKEFMDSGYELLKVFAPEIKEACANMEEVYNNVEPKVFAATNHSGLAGNTLPPMNEKDWAAIQELFDWLPFVDSTNSGVGGSEL